MKLRGFGILSTRRFQRSNVSLFSAPELFCCGALGEGTFICPSDRTLDRAIPQAVLNQ